ncbi:AraC family transcriptional regulator [Marinomonas sp. 15G1-11]|uniref:AraC family transcriptional regulator n=1 Tax=Marinomonas phaeophyticola TaxID=3004091 RepID=A0ABT4JTI0_9GAMM|nr:AraC family transcriptional regulator [Marinomonas sp. 15G1-11]MCZ2721640.1 AraC family transcriptional regulator [Marinomonas sp. 15G1-11]
MIKTQTYCEPFCIQEGFQFEVHSISYKARESYSCFMHFHEVHEFIIFDEIDGSYFYSQGESQLKDNDIVFTPALETHDFELSNKKKSWTIIQFLPEFLAENNLMKEASFLQFGIHLRLNKEQLANVQTQVKWLKDSYSIDPHSVMSLTLLKLLILWVVEHAKPVSHLHAQPITTSKGYERLAPVIDLFRHNTYVELSLVEAAELCHISTSYFSRLFKSIFRFNFSEYTVRHKLYSAARMLTQTNKSITEISYELEFSNPSHFISLFKKQFNITPKQYRNELLGRSVRES